MIKQLLHTGVFGVNTYIIPVEENSNKVFVVDPAACAYSGDEHKILDYLRQNNLECVAVLLTHCHFDHITGIFPIKMAFPEVVIAASRTDAPQVGFGFVNEACLNNMQLEDLQDTLKNQPKPTLLLKNGDDFYGWEVIETPGHTAGSICLYNKQDNELISGDTLFYNGYGRTDLPTGNEEKMMESLMLLRERFGEDVNLFPGH